MPDFFNFPVFGMVFDVLNGALMAQEDDLEILNTLNHF